MAKVSTKAVLTAIIEEINPVISDTTICILKDNYIYLEEKDKENKPILKTLVELSEDAINQLNNDFIFEDKIYSFNPKELYNSIKKLKESSYEKYFTEINLYEPREINSDIINNVLQEEILIDHEYTGEEYIEILKLKSFYKLEADKFTDLSEIDIENDQYIKIAILPNCFGKLNNKSKVSIIVTFNSDNEMYFNYLAKIINNKHLVTYYYGIVLSN